MVCHPLPRLWCIRDMRVQWCDSVAKCIYCPRGQLGVGDWLLPYFVLCFSSVVNTTWDLCNISRMASKFKLCQKECKFYLFLSSQTTKIWLIGEILIWSPTNSPRIVSTLSKWYRFLCVFLMIIWLLHWNFKQNCFLKLF